METIWFCLVAVMIALYVLLDGFDLAPVQSIFWWPKRGKNAGK